MKLMNYFSITSYGAPKRGVVFMFGGWRFKRIWYMPGIRLLTKLGYQTVLFIPKTNLISLRTPLQVLEAAAKASHEFVTDFIEVSHLSEDKEYIAMGVSLGTLFTAYNAVHTPQLDKVVLTSPFGDFKAHVERWEEDRFFKKVIAKQPGDSASIASMLSSIISVDEMKQLEDKELYIYYADNDTIVHTEVTEAMIDEMQRSGLTPLVTKVKGGHQTGVFRSYAEIMKSRVFISS